MANADRKAIEFMVQSALPPRDTNVLWMDTSDPELPIIKTFNAGAWVSVLSSNDKAVEILSKAVLALTQEVELLSGDIKDKMALDETVAKEDTLTEGISDIREDISEIDIDTSGLAKQGDDDQVSLTSLDWDLGRISDDLGEIQDKTNDILGSDTEAIDCEDTIPCCSFDGWECIVRYPNNQYIITDDYEPSTSLVMQIGTKVKASLAGEDIAVITKATNPTVELVHGDYVLSGVDDYLTLNNTSIYICTDIIPISYTPQGGTEITGYLYLYDEYLTEVSNRDIYNKLDNLNIDTSDLAKESTTAKEATLGDVAEVLDYIEQGGMPSITAIAKQGSNANATLSDTQAAVKDGNDTSVSVGKEIRSEVGTGSDTAAESGTLFAVVKWVKDKVKDIYSLIGYTIQEIDGI